MIISAGHFSTVPARWHGTYRRPVPTAALLLQVTYRVMGWNLGYFTHCNS